MKVSDQLKYAAPQNLLGELAENSGGPLSQPFGQQYAAICYRRNARNEIEILLVTSRDTGRWIIPKGWPMRGKKPHRTAAIEAWEEAGVIGKARKKVFGHYSYLKGKKDGSLPVSVAAFLLRVDKLEDAFQEQGQRTREWVSYDEAARRVQEPELKTMLLSIPQTLSAKTKTTP
jgi:8-oxo-dGTP pyrophosphatase MutT (NUDIX family)